jgi:hypothetical protein
MRDTRIRTITKLLFPNRDVHMFISVFHFSFFFVVFLPVFLITITNLRKVYQKSNIFFKNLFQIKYHSHFPLCFQYDIK